MSYSPASNTSGLAQQLSNSIPRTATGITLSNSYTTTVSSASNWPYSPAYAAYQAVPSLSLCYGCRRECSTLKHVESKKGLWLCGDCHVKEGYEW